MTGSRAVEALPDCVFSPETYEIAARLGNHELKSLTFIQLAQMEGFSRKGQIGNAVRDLLKEADAEWLPSGATIASYCVNSFEPAGYVQTEEVPHRKQITTAYRVSPEGEEIGVPFAGMIADWGLRYPDVSTQLLFGILGTQTANRAAHHRIGVLMQLLTHPRRDEGLAVRELFEGSGGEANDERYRTRLSIADQIAKHFQRAELLDIDQSTQANDRLYTIKEAITAERIRRTNDPVMRALFEALNTAFSLGKTDITFEEMSSRVSDKMRADGETFDPATARRRLAEQLSARIDQQASWIESHGSFNEGGHTRLHISPAYEQALYDLAGILIAVDDRDPKSLEEGRQKAEAILSSPADVKALAAKAKKFSSAATKASSEAVADQLRNILREQGPLGAKTLTALFNERYGRKITIARVRVLLGGLAGEGAIQVTQARAKEDINIKHNIYELVEEAA